MNRLKVRKFDKKILFLKKGDVCWVKNIQYGGCIGCKSRPVVIIRCDKDTVTYRRCTSQDSNTRDRKKLTDITCAGLMKETFVEPEDHTIPVSRIAWKMGHLSKEDENWVCD